MENNTNQVEINTKGLTQNAISTKRISLSCMKYHLPEHNVECVHRARKKEALYTIINDASFVPKSRVVNRNVPYELNRKLIDCIIAKRYGDTYVRDYFESILHINSISFKLILEKVMHCIFKEEQRLQKKILQPNDISIEMLNSIRSASLKSYKQGFVAFAHSYKKGDK